jgi:hypothetical protein
MEQSIIDSYLRSLSAKELKAYHIAKSHLGSSFSLEKSRVFVERKERKEPTVPCNPPLDDGSSNSK